MKTKWVEQGVRTDMHTTSRGCLSKTRESRQHTLMREREREREREMFKFKEGDVLIQRGWWSCAN